jgi:hypothetical protein
MKTLSDFPEWQIIEDYKKKQKLFTVVKIAFVLMYAFTGVSFIDDFWGPVAEWVIILEKILVAVIYGYYIFKGIAEIRTNLIRYDENNLYFVNSGEFQAMPWRAVKGLSGEIKSTTKRFGIELGKPYTKKRVVLAAGPGQENSTIGMQDIERIQNHIANAA